MNEPTTTGKARWQDKTGWLGKKGMVYTVDIVNVEESIGGVFLRVYWKGGYWDVTPQEDDPIGEQVCWPRNGWQIEE